MMVADLGIEELDRIFVAGTPGETAEGAEAFLLGEDRMDVAMVETIDKHLAMREELEFFGDLLAASEEVFVVSLTYVGKDAYGWAYDVAEPIHLAGLGDAGLEDSEVVVGLHLPDREGDADLGVVAFGVGDDVVVGGEELDNPILDDGFAVAAGDADDGDFELLAVGFGETLKSQNDILDEPDVGIGQSVDGGTEVFVDIGRDDEIADTLAVEFGDEEGAIVAFGGDGEEEGVFGIGELAAVGQQAGEGSFGVCEMGFDGAEDNREIIYNHIIYYFCPRPKLHWSFGSCGRSE
jgi:hypothetical protein